MTPVDHGRQVQATLSGEQLTDQSAERVAVGSGYAVQARMTMRRLACPRDSTGRRCDVHGGPNNESVASVVRCADAPKRLLRGAPPPPSSPDHRPPAMRAV
jgi:hypothetical protein